MKIFSCTLIVLMSVVAGCKKDEQGSSDSGVYVDFSFTGNNGTLPRTIQYTLTSTTGDEVNWDFGDGGIASGNIVSHDYLSYGCFSVKCTVKREGKQGERMKDVPVSAFPRTYLTKIVVDQIPPVAPGGLDWDAGSPPDIGFILRYPNGNVDTLGYVLSDSYSGQINLTPSIQFPNLFEDMVIEVFDRDPGGLDTFIGNVTASPCDFLADTLITGATKTINGSGSTRMTLSVVYN